MLKMNLNLWQNVKQFYSKKTSIKCRLMLEIYGNILFLAPPLKRLMAVKAAKAVKKGCCLPLFAAVNDVQLFKSVKFKLFVWNSIMQICIPTKGKQ